MKKEFRAVPRPDDIEGMERDLRFHPSTTGSPQALSPQQVESFNRDGFLKNLEGYKAGEIAPIRSFFDELLKKDPEYVAVFKRLCVRLLTQTSRPPKRKKSYTNQNKYTKHNNETENTS